MKTHFLSMPVSIRRFLAVFLALLAASTADAQLRLPLYFSDHAILQRDHPVKLWGWSVPGDELTVVLSEGQYATKAGADSLWRVELPAVAAGGPYRIEISGAGGRIAIEDVYFGDLFFCSGQSNMQFQMKNEVHFPEEVEVNRPLIRHLRVPRRTAIVPQNDVGDGRWIEAGSKTLKHFSAVAYYFAKAIHETEKIPVGIINASWGASSIETFMDSGSLVAFPEAKAQVECISPEFVEKTRQANEQLLRDNPGKKTPPGFINIENRYPTMAYNGMIVPFFHYPVKGVLWYQGEGNAYLPGCYDYRAMLTGLIRSWRNGWKDDKLPFFIVQLANYGKVIAQPEASAWAVVQEAQFRVSRDLPNVRTAVINDTADPKELHPNDKKIVGYRLAAQARKLIYGHTDLVAEGPVLKKAKRKGDAFELSFENIGGGLVCKDGGRQPTGFALAGADNRFYRATAEIMGDKVMVRSAEVPNPVEVRYAFESSPERIDFYNKEGFPAVPFRTDRLRDAAKKY